MDWHRLLPRIARREPDRVLVFRYRVPTGGLPDDLAGVIAEAARAAGVACTRGGETGWRLAVPWCTRVFGVIGREVEEQASIRVSGGRAGGELTLECLPQETHSAHAAGLAGVLVLAAAVWVTGGWVKGAAAALTTALAGALIADFAREMAFAVLERRLRRLTSDFGSAVWPGAPAELLPHRAR
jgi:hypothetical protein